MKKHIFAVCIVLFGLFAVTGVFAQGYTGPGGTAESQGSYTGPGSSPARNAGGLVTVAELKDLRDDARVTLQGTIVNQLSREKYTFRDASGEVVVEIEREIWRRLSETIGENDRVEIFGELDKEHLGARIEIEVKSIRKL